MKSNSLGRMKELIDQILAANRAYYGEDEPIMSDRDYDALIAELTAMEAETGVVFASSPTKKVGGGSKRELEKVAHRTPMLSAKKTKEIADVVSFAKAGPVVMSWKMDGLSLLLRYKKGKLHQAITRGDDGLVGEDVSHNARLIRTVPKTIPFQGDLEVRGEVVVSYPDFQLFASELGHPRHFAAGAVRAVTPEANKLSRLDFFAFELVGGTKDIASVTEQLEFLLLQGFLVVEFQKLEVGDETTVKDAVNEFDPRGFDYPVDGLVFVYDDVAFGKSLGATSHHPNRMLAYKWEDSMHETVFRGVRMNHQKDGKISLVAQFDEIVIDGIAVKQADLHSYGNFQKYAFGIGDKIQVYLANMVIPQIGENLTRSGTYRLSERCPCCGAKLETRVSSSGAQNLYCPNETCIGGNAIRFAKFCDSEAMDIKGLSAKAISQIMSYGYLKDLSDIYHLPSHRDELFSMPGFSGLPLNQILSSIEKSRHCTLDRFLIGIDIPGLGVKGARNISEYFYGSYAKFEEAIRANYHFHHIADVSEAAEKNLYLWYQDEVKGKERESLLKELRFLTTQRSTTDGRVLVTGQIGNLAQEDVRELLGLMGFAVAADFTGDVDVLLVGKSPDAALVALALKRGIRIVTESHFEELTGVTATQ